MVGVHPTAVQERRIGTLVAHFAQTYAAAQRTFAAAPIAQQKQAAAAASAMYRDFWEDIRGALTTPQRAIFDLNRYEIRQAVKRQQEAQHSGGG